MLVDKIDIIKQERVYIIDQLIIKKVVNRQKIVKVLDIIFFMLINKLIILKLKVIKFKSGDIVYRFG